MGKVNQHITKIHPDGRATVKVVETGTEYSARLGTVQGGGATLVLIEDVSGEPIPGALDGADFEQAAADSDAETEALRERRTREARGEAPAEGPTDAVEGAEHVPAQGKRRGPKDKAEADAAADKS